MCQALGQDMLWCSAGDGDLETRVVEMSFRKYFVQQLQAGQVWRAGDNLQSSPADNGFGAEHDEMGSLTQSDPLTTAQQITEIGMDQQPVGGPVSGFI